MNLVKLMPDEIVTERTALNNFVKPIYSLVGTPTQKLQESAQAFSNYCAETIAAIEDPQLFKRVSLALKQERKKLAGKVTAEDSFFLRKNMCTDCRYAVIYLDYPSTILPGSYPELVKADVEILHTAVTKEQLLDAVLILPYLWQADVNEYCLQEGVSSCKNV